MKNSILVLAASAACASAFAPPPVGGIIPSQQQQSSHTTTTQLNVATKGKVSTFRKSLSTLNKDNFVSNLSDMEAFLTQEAGSELYTKSLRRIKVQAKYMGVEVPTGYARVARGNAKRRAKQDAFVSAKVEAAAAAIAAAAEAEAAAEAAEAEAAPEEAIAA